MNTPRRITREDWPKLWVAKFDDWVLGVTGDQHLLGAVTLYPPGNIIGSLAHLPDQELLKFKEIGSIVENLLTKAFNAEWFNYSQAGNVIRKLHIHISPRYSKPREFAGYLFTDEGWGHPMKFRNAEELPDKDIVFQIVHELRKHLNDMIIEEVNVEIFDT